GSIADAELYRKNYGGDLSRESREWRSTAAGTGLVSAWNTASTYIREPPYFEGFEAKPARRTDVRGARALAIFGDSVTTDHISPAGSIKPSSPAGKWLQEHGVSVADFNSYGARRGNHEVMVRGTFANVRIKHLMVPGVEGGVTILQPEGTRVPIHEAALAYIKR